MECRCTCKRSIWIHLLDVVIGNNSSQLTKNTSTSKAHGLKYDVIEHEQTKAQFCIRIPFQYRTHLQRLMRGTELLKEDIDIKNGDVLTLLIDTALYEGVALNHEQVARFMYNLHAIRYQQETTWKNTLDQLRI